MTHRKQWLGLKWRAVLATGAVAFVMLGTLLFHGNKQLDRLEEERGLQERALIIHTIRTLIESWDSGNSRYLSGQKRIYFSSADNLDQGAIRLNLEKLVASSEFNQEVVSAEVWVNGNCVHANQEGWENVTSCDTKTEQAVHCGISGCCKQQIVSTPNAVLTACFDLANAFIGVEHDYASSFKLVHRGGPTARDSYFFSREIGLPDGAGIEYIKPPSGEKQAKKRLLIEFLFLGSVAIIGALFVLFASLYMRLAKIKHILSGMEQILSGDAIGLNHSLISTTSKGFVDEIDMLAARLREVFQKLTELREKEKSGAVDKARREMAEAHANERALLLNQMAKASEEDKASIARELHDEVGQALVSIRVDASIIARSCLGCERQPDVIQRANHIGEACEKLGKSIHYVIEDLRPPAIDTHGLKEAIYALGKEWSGRLQGQTTFSISVAGEVDKIAPSLQSTVYRIVQESITNVAKHSRAKQVAVRVTMDIVDDTKMVLIDISDDGIGFETSGQRRGRGLDGMRERVMANGGAFEIRSSPNKGVTIHCMLPSIERNQ